MRAPHTRTRASLVVATGLPLLIAGVAAALPAPVPTASVPVAAPAVTLSCGMDHCTVRASYVLPARQDDHAVVFEWSTRPARAHRDNAADVVRRRWPSGAGSGQADGTYRYAVSDVIWHSDIRCDDLVTVDVHGDVIASASVMAGKPVPDTVDAGAHCSDQGMSGEVG